MANRIFITHSDRVTLQEAIKAVYVCLVNDVNPGEVVKLTNDLVVFYNDKTKHSSFQVWRTKK